ncbi:MAG: hypothetical protein AAGD22_01680 [Verrucomicrobiota bacterium]
MTLNIRIFLLACVGILLPFLPACTGPKFAAEWQNALAQPPNDIEGAWEGRWISNNSGHQGDLRCLVKKSPDGPNEYDFNYWASWAGIFSGTFPVTYEVLPDRGGYSVQGESNLAPFGVFQHRGHISEERFHATYSSGTDSGTFEMARPD